MIKYIQYDQPGLWDAKCEFPPARRKVRAPFRPSKRSGPKGPSSSRAFDSNGFSQASFHRHHTVETQKIDNYVNLCWKFELLTIFNLLLYIVPYCTSHSHLDHELVLPHFFEDPSPWSWHWNLAMLSQMPVVELVDAQPCDGAMSATVYSIHFYIIWL